jgi:hypothetical protein
MMTSAPNWLELVAEFKRKQKSSEPNSSLSAAWTWPKRRGTSSAHGWRISKHPESNSEQTSDAGVSGPTTTDQK